jgi:hypothetical protein
VLPNAQSVSKIAHALTKPYALREGDPSLDAVEARADSTLTHGLSRGSTRQKHARFATLYSTETPQQDNS